MFACAFCGCKSPDWLVGSVGKQQVWDTLMTFTDPSRTLPTGRLLLRLLIYSFSTAQETRGLCDCFQWLQSIERSLGVFLSSAFSPLIHSLVFLPSFPRSLCSVDLSSLAGCGSPWMPLSQRDGISDSVSPKIPKGPEGYNLSVTSFSP